MVRHAPMSIEAPGVPPSSGFMMGIMVFTTVFYLALAAWAIATVVGLFRMRNWARISMIVIGSGMALAGLLVTLVSAAMPLLMKSVPMPPDTNPAAVRVVFIVIAVVWFFIAVTGIWWVVYFALRRTREAFTQAAMQRGLPPASVTAVYPTPTPMTDFTVARPMVYQAPPAEAETYATPVLAVPPQPSAPARPVSITVIAILMFLGTLACLFMMLLPVPAFFLGVALPGWTGHVLYLVFACISAIAGFGLLRLQKPAWVLSFAFYVAGLMNVLSMAVPSVRQRVLGYQQNLSHTMGMGVKTPVFGPGIMNLFFLCGMVFDVVLFVFLMVLLWRARWAFETRVDA